MYRWSWLLSAAGCLVEPEDPSAPTTPPSDTGTDSPPLTACPAPTESIPHEGSVAEDQTWRADAVHLVPYGVYVEPGATLTIEPCAVVRLGPAATFDVAGRLSAVGEVDAPIRFERGGDAAWGSLVVWDRAFAELRYVTLSGGGDAYFNDDATLVVWGDDTGYTPTATALLQSVRVEDSVGIGIVVDRQGAFDPASTDLVVTGSGSWPVLLYGAAADGLPEGDYTGNGRDEILVTERANGPIATDTTLRDRGVPYRIGAGDFAENLVVDGYWTNTVPLLTIEPGVELRFAPGGGLFVAFAENRGPLGALSAVGTADAPVVFTSQAPSPSAGDWVGVVFDGVGDEGLDPRNTIRYADIGYAGGWSSAVGFSCPTIAPFYGASDGAVLILGRATGTLLTDATLHHSAAHGVVRGWVGEPVDYVGPNSFDAVAGCLETYPIPDGPDVCPPEPPCP